MSCLMETWTYTLQQLDTVLFPLILANMFQACRQGGFEGVCSPSFWLQKILHTAQLYITLLLVSGPLALLPLRITTVQTSLVAAMHLVYSWRTSMVHACE